MGNDSSKNKVKENNKKKKNKHHKKTHSKLSNGQAKPKENQSASLAIEDKPSTELKTDTVPETKQDISSLAVINQSTETKTNDSSSSNEAKQPSSNVTEKHNNDATSPLGGTKNLDVASSSKQEIIEFKQPDAITDSKQHIVITPPKDTDQPNIASTSKEQPKETALGNTQHVESNVIKSDVSQTYALPSIIPPRKKSGYTNDGSTSNEITQSDESSSEISQPNDSNVTNLDGHTAYALPSIIPPRHKMGYINDESTSNEANQPEVSISDITQPIDSNVSKLEGHTTYALPSIIPPRLRVAFSSDSSEVSKIDDHAAAKVASSRMPVTIYHMGHSPPSRAVRMTARAIGLEINERIIDMSKGEHLTPEYEKLNPCKSVPTMDDNGLVIGESRAILSYLVDMYAKNDSLYPRDPQARAVVDSRLFFDIGSLYQKYNEYYMPFIFRGVPLNPDKLKDLEKVLGLLNTFLEGHTYIAGDHLTIADISLAPTFANMETFGFDYSPFPNVDAWFSRIKDALEPFGYKEINQAGADVFGMMYKAKMG